MREGPNDRSGSLHTFQTDVDDDECNCHNCTGSFLVSKDPVTSSSRLPALVLEGPPTIPWPDWTPLLLSDRDLENMSKSELIEAGKEMRRNLGLANQHIAARDGIIEALHATLVIQNLFVEKQSRALNAKETKKKSDRTKLTMDGQGRHLTSDEWIQKTEEAKRLREAEAAAKLQRSKDRDAAKDAKEALEERWKEIKEAHEEAVAAWEDECHTLLAGGCRKKDLPKKPVRAKKPKAVELGGRPGLPEQPDEDDSDSDND
ncbi:hypothetical protein DFH09DRAFT_936779 [Mycena vulgaris]|nr:hypothetical protein DFH09DRAFT_936779 [Mycena vulgaris]